MRCQNSGEAVLFCYFFSVSSVMEKSLKKKTRNTAAKSDPVISKATTKDKDKALRDVVGMWADREEAEDTHAFRQGLWRKDTN